MFTNIPFILASLVVIVLFVMAKFIISHLDKRVAQLTAHNNELEIAAIDNERERILLAQEIMRLTDK